MLVSTHDKNYNTYEDAVSRGIVFSDSRNQKVADIVSFELEKNKDIRILIIVNRIDHGLLLHKMIPNSVFLQGSSSQQKRESGFSSNIVIATSIADFGLDLHLHVLILPAGGRGLGDLHEPVRLIQRLGRGQRRKFGKESVTVYDFYDAHAKYLEAHSKERLAAWQQLGFNVKMIT